MEQTVTLSHTSPHCWWCLYDQNVRPMEEFLAAPSECAGSFCSFECAYAFMVQHDFPESTISMLHACFVRKFADDRLYRAPMPFVLLPYYGGELTYEQFHKASHRLQNTPLHSAISTTAKYIDVMLHNHLKRKRVIDALRATQLEPSLC